MTAPASTCGNEAGPGSRLTGAAGRTVDLSGGVAGILGSTEICVLIGPEDTNLPSFGTTRIHAEAAMGFALGEPIA